MPAIKQITIYQFDELSDSAKERARDWFREGALDYDWWDFIYEDAKDCGKLLGIEISNIFFSGFASQGDGACFEGSYAYRKGSVAAIKSHAPQDTELHRIAEDLAAIQKRHFYGLEASIAHSGHYYHEFCTQIGVSERDSYATDAATEEAVKDALRDFMRWIYRQLEKEYEWQMADEQVDESIRCNAYEFDEDGRLA